jgi:hypothetical protein
MAEAAKKMNIYESITKCMEEIGAVGKDSVNKQQGFKYRGIDAVMNAINPALIHNRVFVVPEVLEQQRQERKTNKGAVLIYSICRIKFTFYAEDGTFIEAVTVGEGMDSGDKATNKAMAIAFKYACFQVFCIPTEEMKDPDGETPDPVKPQFEPASADQLHKMSEFVTAYAYMLNGVEETDVWNELKSRFGFSGTSDISNEMAEKIIEQVEFWYKKQKEKEDDA